MEGLCSLLYQNQINQFRPVQTVQKQIMDSKKIIPRVLLAVKSVFLVGSWLMYVLYKTEQIKYSTNLLWRDINEYSLYLLVLLLLIEVIVYKDLRKILYTFFCICTAFLLEQHITAEGTRLDIWFG